MKKLFLYLSVATFILFTSCENDVKEEEPSSLAIDLQNGYWEAHSGTAISVWTFDTSTVSAYYIEGALPCIVHTSARDYTLEGNVLKIYKEDPLTIEIQGDSLTIEGDGFSMRYERKSTLDYTDC